MGEVNLLRALPKVTRNIRQRESGKSDDVIAIAKQFGRDYFDGAREYGYGGYRYDGRWIPVARDIVAHFSLRPGMRILDVGCAKGFLAFGLVNIDLVFAVVFRLAYQLAGTRAFGQVDFDLAGWAVHGVVSRLAYELVVGLVFGLVTGLVTRAARRKGREIC